MKKPLQARKLLFATLLFLFTAVSGLAQSLGSISGTVRNEEGQPLEGVIMTLGPSNTIILTAEDGSFSFGQLKAGTYSLTVRHLSYQSQHREILINDEMANQQLDLSLKASSTVLQQVEVLGRKETTYKSDYSFIGSKSASLNKDLPQSISTVTKELIDDQQAYTLNEVVKNIAGVNQYSQWDDLTVRGFRNGYASGFRLLNGMRSGFGYGNGFFRVPLTVNLERVEVLKGPGAALYGDINPGGTINMVTKKPLMEERKALSFSVGSFHTTRAALDFTGPMNKEKTLLYRLNIGYEDTETFRDVIKNKSLVIAPTVTFIPTEKTTINAEMVYNNFDGYLDRGLGIQGGDLYALPVSFSLNQPSDFFKVNDFYINTSLNHRFTSWLSFNASYLRFTYEEHLSEHRTLNSFADAPLNTIMNMRYYERRAKEYTDNLSAYFVIDAKTGMFRHQLLAGADYVKLAKDPNSTTWEARRKVAGQDTVNLTFDLKNPVYEIQDPSKYIRMPLPGWFVDYINSVYSTTGIYLQDQLSLSERVQLLLNLRYEHFNDQRDYGDGQESINQGVLLPRLGLTYRLNKNLNYFAGYSSGFQPVNPEFIKFPQHYGSETPFKNETSYQVETGAKGEFFDNALMATFSLYHIERRNMLLHTGQVSPEGNPIYVQNGLVRSSGAELELTGNLRPNLSLNANYAFNLSEVVETDRLVEQGMMNANAPRNSASLWAKYTFVNKTLRGLGFALGGHYVSDRRMQNQVQNSQSGEMIWDYWPSYTVVDAALFYKVNKFRLTANFNNLLNETYFVGGYDYVRACPGAPRNYMASIGYTF